MAADAGGERLDRLLPDRRGVRDVPRGREPEGAGRPRRDGARQLSEKPREQGEPEGGMRTETRPSFLGPRIFAVAILAFGLFVLLGTFQISNKQGFSPDGPRFFPLIVAVGLLLFGALGPPPNTLRRDRYQGEQRAAGRPVTD